jgi:hypothetical protein
MWHAHDDWISPNYLEEMVRIMDEEPRCQLAAASVRWLDFDGHEIQYWPFPNLNVPSRLGRARTLLQNPVAAWVYGLFRTSSLKRALRNAVRFEHVLAFDRVLLLEYILSDSLRGTRNAEINVLITPRTQDEYLPKNLLSQARIISDYMIEHGRSLSRSPFPLSTKARLIPALLEHRRQTFYLHWRGFDEASQRLRFRLGAVRRHPYRYLVKRPARWLVSWVPGSSRTRGAPARRHPQDVASVADVGGGAGRGDGQGGQ